MVWALCLPVLIVVPLLLLGRWLPVAVLAGGIAGLAGLTGLALPGAVDNDHPNPARVERLATDLPVPPGQRLAATARGQQAADAWERVLQAAGWEVDEYSRPAYPGSSGSSWLPQAAQSVVDAPRRVRYERGPWVRASVVPYGDGALVVVSTRP